MLEYSWIYLNKKDSKYAKILNTAKFWIWQCSQYASVTQRSEYTSIFLDRALDIARFLNMSEFWIWQGSEYSSVTQRSNYAA